MFNSTAPSYASADLLYANTPFNELSWIERQWAAYYMWIGSPVLATGLMAFFLHEIVYFGRCIPWIVIDSIPYFRQWKLQPTKVPTPQEQWECTKQVLFAHFTVELPMIWLFHPIAEAVGMSTWQVPFPSWKKQLVELAIFFFFEDMYHYFAHQVLHYGPLYKHVHKIHHKYSAPFGLAAEYAHPAEVLILGMGTIGGPLLYCLITGNLHIFTVHIWITLRLFQAIDAHSGYDFPWSLQHILPFWAGADHHDFHHMAFVDNFATSFRWWDRGLGTDKRYLAYKARMREMREKKGLSEADRAALKQKIDEETEKEGLIAERIVEGKTQKVE